MRPETLHPDRQHRARAGDRDDCRRDGEAGLVRIHVEVPLRAVRHAMTSGGADDGAVNTRHDRLRADIWTDCDSQKTAVALELPAVVNLDRLDKVAMAKQKSG